MHWGGSGIRAVFGARDRKNVKKSKKSVDLSTFVRYNKGS